MERTARVRAIRVGVPKPARFGSRDAVSSFDRQEVHGPVSITVNGLAGDGHALTRPLGAEHHAVYAYPEAHCEWWRRALGRSSLPAGIFSENLTVDGPLETVARVGDLVRCGTALLQISHPRMPCFKLKHRLGLPSTHAFVASRRTGYYLRVIEPGVVSAGDRFEVVDSDGRSPTIDDFIRLSELDYWDSEGLRWLLSARDLVPGLAETLGEKLARAEGADGWFGARELEITERVEDAGAVSLTLRCTSGRPLPPFASGSYVTLDAQPEAGPTARRRYFLSGDPARHEHYRITVAARGDSAAGRSVSLLLHERTQVGDRFRVTAPRGSVNLALVPRDCRTLLIVSGGIGIAAVASLLHEVAHSRPDLHVTVVHEARGAVPLRGELEALARAHSRISLRGALADADALTWESASGLELEDQCAQFVIGPSGFVRRARAWLAAMGAQGTICEESWPG